MSYWTTKQECSREPFFLDWQDFYTQYGLDPLVNPITASTWEVVGGVGDVEFVNIAQTGVFLSGGTPGGAITAKNTIEILGGTYRDCRTITAGVKSNPLLQAGATLRYTREGKHREGEQWQDSHAQRYSKK